MKIYLKIENGRRMVIPVPMWALKFGLGTFAKRAVAKHSSDSAAKYLEYIDFDLLGKNLGILKEYKGMTIVDVKAKDGTEVTVVV